MAGPFGPFVENFEQYFLVNLKRAEQWLEDSYDPVNESNFFCRPNKVPNGERSRNKIIKSAKNHKTWTGILSVEILKYASSKMLKLSVYQIIFRIWEDLQIPDSFLEHILSSIYKKGDKSLCENQ